VSTDLASGLAAALGAAVFYGAAPVAQSVAARRSPAGAGLGLRLLVRLVRNPLWLAGVAGELGGFVLEAYAFSAAPAALVAPAMACDTVVFVLLIGLVMHGRPSRLAVAGAATIAAGTTLLAVAFASRSELGKPASNSELWSFLAITVLVGALAAVAGGRFVAERRAVAATVAFCTAAGVGYGFSTVATRQIGRTFTTAHPWHLFTTPTPYVLIACSVLGVSMLQRGLQATAQLAYPLTSALSAVLPVLVGTTLLEDQAPAGARRIVFVAALILLVAGLALLGRDRSAAEE